LLFAAKKSKPNKSLKLTSITLLQFVNCLDTASAETNLLSWERPVLFCSIICDSVQGCKSANGGRDEWSAKI
jgi:hypothetical protein